MNNNIRCLTPKTRVFTDMGSVFAKQLANGAPFIVLAMDPAEKRMKAKTASLSPVTNGAAINLVTDRGTYEVWDHTSVMTRDGEVKMAAQLKPGDELFCVIINNQDGFILIETAGKSIPLAQLLEKDLEGSKLNVGLYPDSMVDRIQTVKAIQPVGLTPLFQISIDCSSPCDCTKNSGHNYTAWCDGTSFGTGVLLF